VALARARVRGLSTRISRLAADLRHGRKVASVPAPPAFVVGWCRAGGGRNESRPDSFEDRFWKDRVEQAFTAEQACRLSNCTHHQLRYWDKVGLVQPSLQPTGGRPGVRRLYSFRDLVALKVVRSLLDNGMSLQRVRRAWDYLRREGDMDTHLSEVKLVTDGQSIFRVSSDEGELMDALREGQLAFFVAIDEIVHEVEEDVTRFELDRDRFLTMLRRVEDDIEEERKASGS
jgi:DNA-binding transcriptional MerR regulator